MIKVIAYITMLIDHIGLCFFPQCLWLRAIGRVSMPIFSYGIAVGYHHTRQKGTLRQYLMRMAALTLVSQIPYSIMLRTPWKINVGGTFVIALLLLMAYEDSPSIYGVSLWPLPGAALLVLAALAHVDGGAFAVAAILQCYCLLVRPGLTWRGIFACLPLYCVWALLYSQPLYLLAFLAYPLIYVLGPSDTLIRVPRGIAYSIYPTHLWLFSLLRAVA